MESLKCPICSDTLMAPIFHCKNLHNMCGKCITEKSIDKCPLCGRSIVKRNHQIEKVIEELANTHLPVSCKYKTNGCRIKLNLSTKAAHENECKYKQRQCEGKTFCGWKCDWSGGFDELFEHFVEKHKIGSVYMWKEDAMNLKINFIDTIDMRIISFKEGEEIFFYKHRVDEKNQRVYWTFQYVGPEELAKGYVYEFEIRDGPVRKLKIEEYCKGVDSDPNEIFNSGECVALSFATIKSYLNKNGYITIKYRIKKAFNLSNTSKK